MTEKTDNLYTYKNKNGFPILRRCLNCKFWQGDIVVNNSENIGYCKFSPMLFAYTLEPNVYPITKNFYMCVNHTFFNEDMLEKMSERVLLKDALKRKEDIISPD